MRHPRIGKQVSVSVEATAEDAGVSVGDIVIDAVGAALERM